MSTDDDMDLETHDSEIEPPGEQQNMEGNLHTQSLQTPLLEGTQQTNSLILNDNHPTHPDPHPIFNLGSTEFSFEHPANIIIVQPVTPALEQPNLNRDLSLFTCDAW